MDEYATRVVTFYEKPIEDRAVIAGSQMTGTSSVTVLLPVYNGEQYLDQAITSILTQTLSDFSLLIIDDGSTDRTEQIVRSFTDARIRYIRHTTNQGLIATLNEGIGLVRTKYLARMDADDVALPERLAHQVALLDSDVSIAACGTWAVELRDGGLGKVLQTLTGDRLGHEYWRPVPILHPTACVRTDVIRALLYRPEMLHVEDYDLWLRLVEKYHIENIPEVLLQYRVHAASVSRQKRHEQLINSKLAFSEHFSAMKFSQIGFESLIGESYVVSPIERLRFKRLYWKQLFGSRFWSLRDDVLYAIRWLLPFVRARR